MAWLFTNRIALVITGPQKKNCLTTWVVTSEKRDLNGLSIDLVWYFWPISFTRHEKVNLRRKGKSLKRDKRDRLI